MVYYDPHTTGQYNPLHTKNKLVFSLLKICSGGDQMVGNMKTNDPTNSSIILDAVSSEAPTSKVIVGVSITQIWNQSGNYHIKRWTSMCIYSIVRVNRDEQFASFLNAHFSIQQLQQKKYIQRKQKKLR